MAKTSYQSDLTVDEKMMIAIVRAAEHFKRAHAVIFKRYGLSFPQYNILRVLEASRGGQNKISAVGRIMLVPGANMTGLAKRLEQQGFILRKPDPADERVTLLVITKKGQKTLELIRDEKDRVINIILQDFSDPDKQAFLHMIKNIIQQCRTLT